MSEKSKKGDFMADFAEPQVPDGLFQKCEKCGEIICSEDVVTNYHTCPNCQAYFRVPPRAHQYGSGQGKFYRVGYGASGFRPAQIPGVS